MPLRPGRVNLHLGCGKRNIPGFVNIDIADYPHIDYQSDIGDLYMFEDKAVDLIYVCHAFEYLSKKDALNALDEWHRVLRTGGILRLAVPDWEALIQVYEKTKELYLIWGPLYGRMEVGDKEIYHKMVYDYATLERYLRGAGFKDVRRWDWKQVWHGKYDDHSKAYYPHDPKEIISQKFNPDKILISLNIEATK